MAAAEADVVIIHPQTDEEFKFHQDETITVQSVVSFFWPSSPDRPATLCRLSDNMILWPAQRIPPGRYRVLVAPPAVAPSVATNAPARHHKRSLAYMYAWSTADEEALLDIAQRETAPLDFGEIARRHFCSRMDAETVRVKLVQLQQRS